MRPIQFPFFSPERSRDAAGGAAESGRAPAEERGAPALRQVERASHQPRVLVAFAFHFTSINVFLISWVVGALLITQIGQDTDQIATWTTKQMT